MSRLSRRAVLAALGASVAVGGCQRQDAGDRSTLTPAPVPEASPRERRVPQGARSVQCPQHPQSAEAYVCSPLAEPEGSMRLLPGTKTYDAGTGGMLFRLLNRTDSSFRTGRDWWIFSAHDGERWSVVSQGDRTDRVVVDPDGVFLWILAGKDPEERIPRIEVDFGGGLHALTITGYVGAGELTAVTAPFWVRPLLG